MTVKNLVIRQAELADVEQAAPLLVVAGQPVLNHVFGLQHSEQALAYVKYAWLKGNGQYGAHNHVVAQIDDVLVGIACCWHANMPEDFDRATLSSITDFYGVDDALKVVMRSQYYMATLEAPMATELAIGHLAVSKEFEGQGIGRALIDFMYKKGQSLRKNALVLNVYEENIAAKKFYERCGFGVHRCTPPFIQMIRTLELL